MLFLEKLEQKKFYIILVLIICIIIGFIYTIYFVQPQYVAEATLVCLKTEKTPENKVQTNGSLELTDNMVSTFKEIAKSTLTIKETQKNAELDIKSEDIVLKKLSDSDTFSIQIKSKDYDKLINFSNEFIEIFSKKAEIILNNAEIYVVDTPYIEDKTYGNSFFTSIGISILIGITIILIYIAFLIQFDKKIKNIKEVESEISLRNLASIPLNNKKRKTDLVFDENSNSLSSKAFKNLRANIQFVNVNNKGKNTILITSPKNAEGKSYIAANLSVSFAEAGKKVMLIDADMNTGRQSKIFNIPNNLGLSNYLSNLDANGIEINELVNKFINETEFKNLNLITSGTIPPNTSELLSSPKLIELIKDLTVFYDVLIIDAGKVLSETDALILTRVVNSTILVSSFKKTNKDDLWQAKKDIQNVGGRIIGNILNKTSEKEYKNKDKLQEKNIKKERKFFEEITKKIVKEFNKLKKYILELKNKSNQKLLIEGNKDNTLENSEIIENTINYITPIEEISDDKAVTDFKEDASNTIIEEKEGFNNNTFIENKEKNINILEDNIIKDQNLISDKKNSDENLEQSKNSLLEEVEFKKESSEEQNLENNVYSETEVKVIYKNKVENQEDAPKIEVKQNVSIKNFDNIKQNLKVIFKKFESNFKNFTEMTKDKFQKVLNISKNNKIEEDEEKYVVEENEEKVIDKANLSRKKDVGKKADDSSITNNIMVEDDINKDNKENLKENEKIITEELEEDKKIIDDLKDNDEAVLVIVDAENGYCRAFNKYCFTEKAVRGIDPVDGFNKANYSAYLLKKRLEDLMNLYGITEKQAKRIDTLIYSALIDFDDTVWLERKMTSNKADIYAKCMAKDYEIIPGEEKNEYEKRCKNLRKQELRDGLIEIEYILDGLWKSKTISFTDKLVMNRFAGIYDSSIKLLKDKSLNLEEMDRSSKFDKLKRAVENNKLTKAFIRNIGNIREKLSNIKVKQVKVKTVEEIQKEVLENNKNISNDDYDNMSIEEYYNENTNQNININYNKNIEEIDYKKVEAERKRELEFFKEQKREEKMIQKRIAMEERKAKKIERKKKREEVRKNKELEKQKQRQEAKIEEELLVDNLYPKTKNNKDI